jgi:uroporphyrinogen decarboxylase
MAMRGLDDMTSRERVLAALMHQQPDRTPAALVGADLLTPEGTEVGSDVARERLGADVRFIRAEPTAAGQGFDEYLRSLPQEVFVGNLEQLRRYHAWDYRPERSREDPTAPSPLRDATSVGDLEDFAFPDFGRDAVFARLRDQVDEYHRRGLAVFALPPRLGGTLFEAAWRLRGFEEYLCELSQGSPISLWLLDRLADLGSYYAGMVAAAGADVLFLGDDVGEPVRLMISPDLWRRTIGPRMRRIVDAARAVKPDIHVCYHSDGCFTGLLEHLIDVGVDAIEPVQPDVMDPVAIKRAFGQHLTLVGCVGTAWLWHHGRPDQIRAEVGRTNEQLSRDGGLILAPAYDLMPVTPWENVEAFFDEVHGTAG